MVVALNDRLIEIDAATRIPLSELSFRASRASGPGGQHVNKTSSRVTLLFDVEASPSLRPEQKARLRERLATRITRAGVLMMHAQRFSSQHANRALLIERFAEVLREALRVATPRRPTRPTRASEARRRRAKERRSRVKRDRRRPGSDDG